jgi:hypothetical protein
VIEQNDEWLVDRRYLSITRWKPSSISKKTEDNDREESRELAAA